MKPLIMCCFMCTFITSAHAQLFKKLQNKVNQSAKSVTTKVKTKAETAPDRIIDHAATKVETKAETKITNKENKANNEVDKTVDKVDSVKLKRQKKGLANDTVANNAPRRQSARIRKNGLAIYALAISHSFDDPIFLFATKPGQIILNGIANNKKYQA